MGDSEKYESLLLRNQLCFPVYLCAKEITRRYTPLLDELSLTYTQYIVMMYFWEIRRPLTARKENQPTPNGTPGIG